MGERLNGLLDNGVNGTEAFSKGASSGRCPVGEQRRPGRHPATARMMWSKNFNKVVMGCYLKSKPVNENGVPIRGYRIKDTTLNRGSVIKEGQYVKMDGYLSWRLK